MTAGGVQERQRGGASVREVQRVPPHNLEAEESLLGAMMLSRAAAAWAKRLDPADFYKPAHAVLFAAMQAVEPGVSGFDPVTLSDHLARKGELEKAGGTEALTALQLNTPAIGNAGRYAELVVEHSRARRLILAFRNAEEASWRQDLEGAAATLDEAAALLAQADAEAGLEFEDVAAVVRGEVAAIEPTMLRRSDGKCLIYPGLLHWLMGEHGKGKSWVALHVGAEILGGPVQASLLADVAPDAGEAVMVLDWEQNRRIVGSRLVSLGAAASAVEARFLYLRPPPLTKMLVERLVVAVRERKVVLVICDGVAKALARQGWDEDRAGDVLAWIEILATPLMEAGAAVLCLDHMSKDSEKRGLWARGSGAKMGEASTAWVVRPRESFSRAKGGSVELVQAKDREGMVAADGEVAALVRLQPHDHGRLEIRVLAPADKEAGQFRPTQIMQKISEHLEMAGGPVTKRTLRACSGAKGTTTDVAIELLTTEGYAARGPKGWTHIRPFVAPAEGPAADPGAEDDDYREEF